MARMLLYSFLWTAACNTPNAIWLGYFSAALKQDPIAESWLQTCIIGQYGMTPVKIMLSILQQCHHMLPMQYSLVLYLLIYF